MDSDSIKLCYMLREQKEGRPTWSEKAKFSPARTESQQTVLKIKLALILLFKNKILKLSF